MEQVQQNCSRVSVKTRGCDLRTVLVNDIIICVQFRRRSLVFLGRGNENGRCRSLHEKCMLYLEVRKDVLEGPHIACWQ